jgi:hypothetical protein
MRGLTALIGRLGQEERGREAARRSSDRGGAPARAKQRRGKKGRGREGRLTGGAGVSLGEEKRERDGGAWAAAGKRKAGCWAAGPKGKVVLFLFLFQFKLFLSNSNQNSSNPFTKIYKLFLNFTQATKNYAKPNNDAQTLVVSKLIKLN